VHVSEVSETRGSSALRPEHNGVLLVDDEGDLLLALSDLLEGRGYCVSTASDGEMARTRVLSERPAVALIDIRLGARDGIREMVELRKLQPNLLCMMMTAYADTDTAVRAVREGAYGFLRKPFDPPELLASIERCFDRVRLEGEKQAAQDALRARNLELEELNAQLQASVSEALQARQAMAALRRRERAILDASRDAIICVDGKGDVKFASQSTERIFGWPPTELVDRPVDALLAKDADAGGLEVLARAAEQTGKAIFEIEAIRRDGTAFPCEVVVSQANTDVEGGELLVGTFRDKTAQRQAQQEKDTLAGQLLQAQKMEALGQLAGGIAHDFNNLLTVVTGNADEVLEVLSEDPSGNEELIASLNDIAGAAARASELTSQLLAFGRQQRLRVESLDVNARLRDLERMLRRTLSENIQFSLDLTSELGRVEVDPGQFDQVIMNLVINARDAMPQGGELTVKTGAFESGAHSWVRVQVQDTGCGMDSAVRDRIFEPFFSTKGPGHGTGLGLSTAYGIVDQAGGSLTVESTPSVGSTFSLILPATAAQAARVENEAERKAIPQLRGTETILLCEDDGSVRELTARVLSKAGYDVLVASRPEVALELAAQAGSRIVLLVTDVIMPRMNGLELVNALRTKGHHLEALFISGYAAPVLEQEQIRAARASFLRKPFTSHELLSNVREILDRRAVAAARAEDRG